MISSNSADQSRHRPRKNLEWMLVIISSILLGIWAVKETIALRNSLLLVGSLISIFYMVQEWRYGHLKEGCSLWKTFPIFLLGLIFVWVIAHYFLLSIDPVKQLAELKSTWLRAFLASIIGVASGLALRNYPNRLNLLWLGIFVAFLALFYQYIPRALLQNKLLVPDYDYYLFHLKSNTVLMGMILIAGIDGALFDYLRSIHFRWSGLKLWRLAYWVLSTSLALWAFVFIVDARNGIGLSIILYSFWFICALVFFIHSQIYRPNLKSFLIFLVANIGLCLVLYFAYLQTTVNKGWHTLLKDAKLAVQIDVYPHWQSPAQMGYPKHEDGQVVTPNNYERIAWAVAGTRAILQYPQGVGVLAYPFAKHPQVPPNMPVGPNVPGIATHSGWVELGLAFGLPILGLIFSILLITFINAVRGAYPAKMTTLGLIVLLSSLYLVSEVTIQHGIEIMIYLLALVPALMLVKPFELESER